MESHIIADSEVWEACYMDSDRLRRRTYHNHHYRHSPFLLPRNLRAYQQVLDEIEALPLTVLIPRGVDYWVSF